MRKLIASALIFLSVAGYPLQSLADCDFSTGIEKLADGRYAYSVECHKKVGKMVQDLKDRQDEVGKLNDSIKLKDLALTTQEQRANMWMDTSMKLEDRVNTIDKYNTTNHWLYFGLGVVFTGLSVWGAGQLRR